MTFFFTIFLYCICNIVLAQNEYQEKQRVAVLEFRGIDVNPNLLLPLAEEARGGARSALPTSEFDITSREGMKSMLSDMGKDISDCDVECEVELGRVLNANYVVSGNIYTIDNMYILTLKLHDTMSGSLMGQKSLRDTDKFALIDKTRAETKALMVEQIALNSNQLTGQQVEVLFKDEEFSSDNPTTIIVGQNVVGSCTKSPCKITAPQGRFDVQFGRKGYATDTQNLDLQAQAKFSISLNPVFSMLNLTAPDPKRTGRNLSIRLTGPNNFEDTRAGYNDKKLDPGRYTAIIEDNCYVETGLKIVLKPGDEKSIEIPVEPRLAGLHIIAYNTAYEPVPANIFIDGVLWGTAPYQDTVPLCSKELTLTYAGLRGEKSLKKTLNASKISEMNITLD